MSCAPQLLPITLALRGSPAPKETPSLTASVPGGALAVGRWAVACAIAVCLLFAAAAVPAPAEPARRLPVQGVYDTCTPEQSGDGCASRLRLLSAAGFRVVTNGGAVVQVSNLGNVLNYASTARAYGMKVIWNLRVGVSDADLRRTPSRTGKRHKIDRLICHRGKACVLQTA